MRAELIGCDTCVALDITVRAYAPVMELCRRLVQAGEDPARPLHAYRREVLAITVRSIREGAKLTVEDDRLGTPRLRPWRARSDGAASPVAPSGYYDQRNGSTDRRASVGKP